MNEHSDDLHPACSCILLVVALPVLAIIVYSLARLGEIILDWIDRVQLVIR